MGGIDYIPIPDSIKITKQTNVELIGDNAEKGWYEYTMADISIAKPETYLFQGKKYSFIGGGTHITEASETDYYYKLTSLDDKKTQIEILDRDKKILWKAVDVKHSYPDYMDELSKLFEPLRNYPKPRHEDKNEILTERCPITFLPETDFYGNNKHVLWQQQEIVSLLGFDHVQSDGFCGDIFDAVVSLEVTNRNEFEVMVFDSEKFLTIWHLDEFDEENAEQKAIADKLVEYYKESHTLNDVIDEIVLGHDEDGNPYASLVTDFGRLDFFREISS